MKLLLKGLFKWILFLEFLTFNNEIYFYLVISNEFQKKSTCPKMAFFSCFHVMGSKEYKFWSSIIYQTIWSYILELCIITFNELIFNIFGANITYDEPIKKACHQKINRILLTYLLRPTYLPTHAYLPNCYIKLILIYNIFDGIYN